MENYFFFNNFKTAIRKTWFPILGFETKPFFKFWALRYPDLGISIPFFVYLTYILTVFHVFVNINQGFCKLFGKLRFDFIHSFNATLGPLTSS